eukprot:2558301-Amphidinium_carterae.1
MNENYIEEEHIGKAIMQEFFTKTCLTDKQETRQAPPDLDNVQAQPDDIVDIPDKEVAVDTQPVHIPPPPGLEQPPSQAAETIPEVPVQAPNAAPAETAPYKPTHRLTGKQPPRHQPIRAILAQLDDITSTKELRIKKRSFVEVGKRLFTIHPRHGHADICSYTIFNGYEEVHSVELSVHNRCCKRIPQYTNRRGSVGTTAKGVLSQSAKHLVEDD